MYRDTGAWNALMTRFVDSTALYLNAQIAAGAQVVQIFDSWVGTLGPQDYRRFVQPHMARLFAELDPAVPAIQFGADTGSLLELQRDAGGSVIGLDWRVDLARSWKRLGSQVAVQGNLDPVVLFADLPEIERQTRRILEQAGGRPGHIFNLGHGILPQTPVDHVRALVDMVHNFSQPGRKHHISVDTMGLLLAVAVTSAAVDDAAAAPKVLGQLTRKSFPRLRKLWADTKYHNHALNRWVSKNGWYVIEIVSRPTGDRRFKLLPWRWVVERTFGWLGRCRIHSKDYEHLTDSSEAQIRVSMIQLMLRRLTGAKYRDRFRYKRPRRRTPA